MFDEQPDGDIHGACAAEIHRLETQLAEEAEAHGTAMNDLSRKYELEHMWYERECRLHDNKKAECLRLDKLLRECEEREESVPFHTETISVIVNIAVYGLVFAAGLKYLFWG